MVSRRALRGTEPLGHVAPTGPSYCPLCNRPLEPGPSVDEHHLVKHWKSLIFHPLSPKLLA